MWQATLAARAEALAKARFEEVTRQTARAERAEALAVKRLEEMAAEKKRADSQAGVVTTTRAPGAASPALA